MSCCHSYKNTECEEYLLLKQIKMHFLYSIQKQLFLHSLLQRSNEKPIHAQPQGCLPPGGPIMYVLLKREPIKEWTLKVRIQERLSISVPQNNTIITPCSNQALIQLITKAETQSRAPHTSFKTHAHGFYISLLLLLSAVM